MKMIIDISDNDIKWAYDYYKFPDIQSKINTENLARVIRNGTPVLVDNATNGKPVVYVEFDAYSVGNYIVNVKKDGSYAVAKIVCDPIYEE